MSNLLENLEIAGKLNVLFTVVEANGMNIEELIATFANAEKIVISSGEDEIELECCQSVLKELIQFDEDGEEKVLVTKKVCGESLKKIND